VGGFTMPDDGAIDSLRSGRCGADSVGDALGGLEHHDDFAKLRFH
jgi:hypothetical protein